MIFLVVVLAVSGLLFYRHKTWKAQSWPVEGVKPASWQAHRGFWKAGAQENSYSSFVKAREMGFQMFELDVRLSQDEVPVVFHDGDLKRIAQKDLRVTEVAAADLKSWAGACTLEEVLASKDIPASINIEIKSNSVFDSRLEKRVAELVKKYHREKDVMFSSFNPISIWRLSRLLPQVPRALLATGENDPENKVYLKKLWLAPYVGVNALNLDYRFVTPNEVRAYKERGIPVALWTVNDLDRAKAYLQAGAISIISDVEKSVDSFS
ncbi:glycerophosphodiester phosphodiesterase [Bdellovibrio bacteriovorus]|uniref:glycerophosphodiester phosphodiesterase n=1 Tax=Bdellovibrio bacteriovorus TaxID=959 RepID=UPI003AA8CFB1